jgi:hypothetical protein
MEQRFWFAPSTADSTIFSRKIQKYTGNIIRQLQQHYFAADADLHQTLS